MHNRSHRGNLKAVVASAYSISLTIILLVCVFGILNNTITTAIAQQQQQITGKINGMGTSQIPLRVCSKFYTKDFLTIQFDASYLLSQDGKTGKVTSGSGLLKTTDSEVYAPLSITGGTINIGVEPKLYTLKGTANFQSSSSSSCNPSSAVEFSIAKPDGTQLKCGNTDLITFNSIPMKGSITGNVNCIVPAVGTTPIPPQYNIKTHTASPDYVKIISASDGQGNRISNGAVNVTSKSIEFQLSRPTDYVGVASVKCNIDGSITDCQSLSGRGSIISYHNLNPGSHTFTFTAKDSSGNESSDRFTWTISAKATS